MKHNSEKIAVTMVDPPFALVSEYGIFLCFYSHLRRTAINQSKQI